MVGGLGKWSRSREGLCNSSPRLCLAEVQVAIQERICTRPLRVSRDKECESVSAGLQAGEWAQRRARTSKERMHRAKER